MQLVHKLSTEFNTREASPEVQGRVVSIRGGIIFARLPYVCLGDVCLVKISSGKSVYCQVVSFDESCVMLAPYSDLDGLYPGCKVFRLPERFSIELPKSGGGMVIDALGNDLRRQRSSASKLKVGLFNSAPDPLKRLPVKRQLETGVKSIDACCPIGYGQRLGLFAAAGVGKSTLLAMLARNAAVDLTVIALTGERGREVAEFIVDSLGRDGLERSVVVVATSDRPALQRSLAPVTATAIAEYHRQMGKNVLLLVDSLTRAARAIRDVSLAAGELPIRQGLTPAVYSELPKLIERAGNNESGSITAIYTLLDGSEFEHDPLSEEVKSLLDGHICLSHEVAMRNIRPAIDLTRSISRCVPNICGAEQRRNRDLLLSLLAKLKKEKDLIAMGGTPDKELKAALALEPEINSFLSQTTDSFESIAGTLKELERICARFEDLKR